MFPKADDRRGHKTDRADVGYVSSPDSYAAGNTLDGQGCRRSSTGDHDNDPNTAAILRIVNPDADTILWNFLGMPANRTFRTVIKVDISGTQSQAPTTLGQIRDPDDTSLPAWRDIENDGIYPFYTSVAVDSSTITEEDVTVISANTGVIPYSGDLEYSIEHPALKTDGVDIGLVPIMIRMIGMPISTLSEVRMLMLILRLLPTSGADDYVWYDRRCGHKIRYIQRGKSSEYVFPSLRR